MSEIMKIKPSAKAGEVVMEIKPGDEAMLGRSIAPLASDSLIKLKTILVPVDFSDRSKQALACAVPFARQFGVMLELVYVVAPYYGFDPNGLNGYPIQETESAGKLLNELARDVVPMTSAAKSRCVAGG